MFFIWICNKIVSVENHKADLLIFLHLTFYYKGICKVYGVVWKVCNLFFRLKGII